MVTTDGPPGRGSRRVELVRSDLESLMDELDRAMADQGIVGTIELVGGAAMALAHYDRVGTTDVDGAIAPAEEILALASAIGERHGLRADWLNTAAQGFIPPGDTGDEPQVVRAGRSLTVKVAGARTLLAMKLRAARPIKDADDIAVLLRACGIATLDQARAVLDEMYDGEHELSERGERMVLGALRHRQVVQAGGAILDLPPIEVERPTACGRWILRRDRRCTLDAGHAGGCG